MRHFLLALVSQFHVLHFFAFLLLLDFVSLLLIVLVLAQAFSSQLLSLLAFLLLLSLGIPYSPFLVPLLLLFLSLHSLGLLSPFPELKPLLAPLPFSEPLFFPALYFLFLVYVPLHVHLPFQYTSAPKLLYLSLVAPSATQFAVSAALILLYVIFQHFLLLFPLFLPSQVFVFPLQVSVFPLQVSVFPLFLPSQVSVSLLFLLVHASLHVFVSLHPVSSSSSFASYFPLSSVD